LWPDSAVIGIRPVRKLSGDKLPSASTSMLIKQFDDVLTTFGYARENREAAMPKLRFVITALAALFAGYLGGAISRPAPPLTTLSALPVLARSMLAAGLGPQHRHC
jgi:hypothetical protein